MGRKVLWLLGGILLLGFILRVYRVSQVPMYGDELTLVYDSYSVLKTGMDQTGQFLPVNFKMRGLSAGGYVYGSIPFVAIFGPTELGVRGLSILSGMGIIALMYFLGKKFFNEKIGLIASFLAAISPWDIYLSRAGYEAHFALFLALSGLLLFLNKKYIFWAITWGLAVFTYPTFKFTLPVMFLVLVWYKGLKNVIKSKTIYISLAILAIFAGVVVFDAFMAGGEKRLIEINIFNNVDIQTLIVQNLNNERTISTLPKSLKPIFYNRPFEYMRVYVDNYFDNLSPRFLFLRGDGNPRNNPGEWGMLYLVEFPLLIFGLINLWKTREFNFLVTWILIVPLATAFIANAHGLRNDFMIPPLILISSYAISRLSRGWKGVVFAAMLIQLMIILQEVYFLAPAKFATFWSAEAKSASLLAIKESREGKKVILSTLIDNIEYAYPVYAKIDPKEEIAQYGKFPKVYGNVEISNER